MVLNIASAALVVQDRNNGVSCFSYLLSFIELIYIFFGSNCIKYPFPKNSLFILFVFFVLLANIVYSSMAIEYYQNGKPVDDDLYNSAITVLVANSLSILLYYGYS